MLTLRARGIERRSKKCCLLGKMIRDCDRVESKEKKDPRLARPCYVENVSAHISNETLVLCCRVKEREVAFKRGVNVSVYARFRLCRVVAHHEFHTAEVARVCPEVWLDLLTWRPSVLANLYVLVDCKALWTPTLLYSVWVHQQALDITYNMPRRVIGVTGSRALVLRTSVSRCGPYRVVAIGLAYPAL
ncbi:hypothetical protein KQX54_013379 [Cotesia glomerata]|uniref:Uncharacterized protein n=1 Tax=Cotesia glomerata TaxID=32391 RepID=A0AAV7J3H5_COTGL|nr:hypothetical protein KQX54_013379 [Cotesia glomerata]